MSSIETKGNGELTTKCDECQNEVKYQATEGSAENGVISAQSKLTIKERIIYLWCKLIGKYPPRSNDEYECVKKLEEHVNDELVRIHALYGYTIAIKSDLPRKVELTPFRRIDERFPGEFHPTKIAKMGLIRATFHLFLNEPHRILNQYPLGKRG